MARCTKIVVKVWYFVGHHFSLIDISFSSFFSVLSFTYCLSFSAWIIKWLRLRWKIRFAIYTFLTHFAATTTFRGARSLGFGCQGSIMFITIIHIVLTLNLLTWFDVKDKSSIEKQRLVFILVGCFAIWSFKLLFLHLNFCSIHIFLRLLKT